LKLKLLDPVKKIHANYNWLVQQPVFTLVSAIALQSPHRGFGKPAA